MRRNQQRRRGWSLEEEPDPSSLSLSAARAQSEESRRRVQCKERSPEQLLNVLIIQARLGVFESAWASPPSQRVGKIVVVRGGKLHIKQGLIFVVPHLTKQFVILVGRDNENAGVDTHFCVGGVPRGQ